MIIGARVVVKDTGRSARVLIVHPDNTLTVVPFGSGIRVRVPRYTVRYPTADERLKGER